MRQRNLNQVLTTVLILVRNKQGVNAMVQFQWYDDAGWGLRFAVAFEFVYSVF